MNSMIKRFFNTLVFLGLLSVISIVSHASIDVYEFEDEAKRAEFVSLTKELRCPKCQNQDIADSNAPIAADMRKEVHRLLQEGQDRESIIDHMIERFGDFVTYKPRLTAETFMLWYGPWLIVIIGLLIIATMIRMKKTSSKHAEAYVNEDQKNNASASNPSASMKEEAYSTEVKKLLDKYDEKSTERNK